MCQPRWRGAAAGLLSFSFGIQERGAGEQVERRRAGLWHVLVEPGETRLIRERARVTISPPSPGGRRILVSLLGFFCLYCKLLGFGTKVTLRLSPARGSCRKALRGAGTPREPPGPQLGAQEELGLQDEHVGTRGSGSLCAHWAKPKEPPLWSSHPVPAKGSTALAALCAFPVPPAAAVTRTAQNPCFSYFILVPPFPLAESRLCFGPFFCSGTSLSWPGACGLVPPASLAAVSFPFGFFCSCCYHHSNHLCHKTGAHWTISSP